MGMAELRDWIAFDQLERERAKQPEPRSAEVQQLRDLMGVRRRGE